MPRCAQKWLSAPATYLQFWPKRLHAHCEPLQQKSLPVSRLGHDRSLVRQKCARLQERGHDVMANWQLANVLLGGAEADHRILQQRGVVAEVGVRQI